MSEVSQAAPAAIEEAPLPPPPPEISRVSVPLVAFFGFVAMVSPLIRTLDGPLALPISVVIQGLALLYPVRSLYRTAADYQRLVPEHRSTFRPRFWSLIVSLVAAFAPGAFGYWPRLALLVLTVLLGALVLADVLATRSAALVRLGAKPDSLTVTPALMVLWFSGCALSTIGVGLLVLAGLTLLYFAEHNKVVSAVYRARTPRPIPATPVYGVSLPATYCHRCGGALAADGLFCTSCGKAA
ncbi:MAG: hypothetical protein QM767_27330 [Anaeromyxobacter sp.]